MSAGSFLLSLFGLASLTYLMRLFGVRLGMASRAKDSEEDQAPTTSRVWMDRATVVLITAVAATTMFFDGRELADWPRLIGVGVGVAAAFLRAPMLAAVILAIAVTACMRAFGWLV